MLFHKTTILFGLKILYRTELFKQYQKFIYYFTIFYSIQTLLKQFWLPLKLIQ